jgi:4-amino-4-deoxychorismate lyase
MFLVHNGTLSDAAAQANAPILMPDNRAFQYGDGLFETMRYQNGHVWFWPDHLARLHLGLTALHLDAPTNFADTVSRAIAALLTANDLTNSSARIKLTVWRQPGGLYAPASRAIDWLLTAAPAAPFAVVVKPTTAIAESVRLVWSSVSACKTLSALPYVLAGLERQQRGLDEIILLNTDGFLAECGAANLCWISQNTLFTPALESGCLAGVMRQQVLRRAIVAGLTVREGLFRPDVLIDADAVFSTNVMGATLLNGTSFGPLLQQLLDPNVGR